MSHLSQAYLPDFGMELKKPSFWVTPLFGVPCEFEGSTTQHKAHALSSADGEGCPQQRGFVGAGGDRRGDPRNKEKGLSSRPLDYLLPFG